MAVAPDVPGRGWHVLRGLLRAGPGIVLVSVLSSVLPGCATPPAAYSPPVAEAVRESARLVRVVPLHVTAGEGEPDFGAPVGKGRVAAKEGAIGAGAGLVTGLMLTVAAGPMGPFVAPIMIPALAVSGAATGAAVGWSKAVPVEDARAAEAALARSRDDLTAEVARKITDRLPTVGKAATPGTAEGTELPDLRIEVSVDRWGLAGGAGSDPLTGFFVAASFRVVQTRDGSAIAEGQFVEGGPQRPVSEWISHDAAPVARALETTLSRVADAVVDNAFLVHDFHVERPGLKAAICGLRPISPRAIRHFGVFETKPERVGSVSPRLVWESFPRSRDVEDDPSSVLARVADVRYDLRIWTGEHGGPGELVYQRDGLVLVPVQGAVAHAVQAPLAPASQYLWSVRARFRLDGAERVTRWSHDMFIHVDSIPLGIFDTHLRGYAGPQNPYEPRTPQPRNCRDETIPPLHYLAFQTP